MKRTNRILSMILGAAIIFGASSCKTDEPDIPSGGDGIPVADGFYLAKTGEDPVSTAQLKTALVDAPDFKAMSREGFVQGYMYLTAGSYNLVEVASKAIVKTYGGSVLEITDGNAECDVTAYSLIDAAVDGAAFTISTEGLYVVAYDATLEEIVYDQIESVGIIGGATPGGWSEDTKMIGSVTAEGGSWTVEGVVLNQNQMKFRYNCRWAIDRRIDKGENFDNANGFSLFTNYGNEIGNLLSGNEGANIEVPERAEYTVTFAWDPANGVSGTLTKTNDVEPLPDYPAELYIIGSAIGGWDWEDDPDNGVVADGIQLHPVANGYEHLFWAIVWMDAVDGDGNATGFKFAPEQAWGNDFGVDGTDPVDGVYAKGTAGNVPGPATAGYYMVVVNLEGAGTIERNAPLVYGIGDAFGGNWDGAFADYLFTVDNANGVLNSIPFVADKELRIHVAASTLTKLEGGGAIDWWAAEFTVLNGVIEYRGSGGDQARFVVTTGQTLSLNFKDGTGTFQ